MIGNASEIQLSAEESRTSSPSEDIVRKISLNNSAQPLILASQALAVQLTKKPEANRTVRLVCLRHRKGSETLPYTSTGPAHKAADRTASRLVIVFMLNHAKSKASV